MKRSFKSIMSMTVVGIALALAHPWAAPAATVIISPPVVMTPVPESYVWDGTEYVGVVNGQYYYLGPGNVWIAMDAPRMHRFHAWEHTNPNWQAHATHNTRYRGTSHGPQPQPLRHAAPPNANQNPQHNVNPGHHGP